MGLGAHAGAAIVAACSATLMPLVGIERSAHATHESGKEHGSWSFALKPDRKNRSTSVDSIIEPAKVDDSGTPDPADDKYASAAKVAIKFPRGSRIDTSAPPVCRASGERLEEHPERCADANVGGGRLGAVLTEEDDTASGETSGLVTAYNRRHGLALRFRFCEPGTGPRTGKPCVQFGSPVVANSKLDRVGPSRRPRLGLAIPAGPPGLELVITRLTLGLDKIGARRQAYLRSPRFCSGRWRSSARITYPVGSAVIFRDHQRCRD